MHMHIHTHRSAFMHSFTLLTRNLFQLNTSGSFKSLSSNPIKGFKSILLYARKLPEDRQQVCGMDKQFSPFSQTDYKAKSIALFFRY